MNTNCENKQTAHYLQTQQPLGNTYPWPIFSNRVYFFLGSPTLTILPEMSKTRQILV